MTLPICSVTENGRKAQNSLGTEEKAASRPLGMLPATNGSLSAPRPGLHPAGGGFTQGHIVLGFPIHKSTPGLRWTPPGKELRSPEGRFALLLHPVGHVHNVPYVPRR